MHDIGSRVCKPNQDLWFEFSQNQDSWSVFLSELASEGPFPTSYKKDTRRSSYKKDTRSGMKFGEFATQRVQLQQYQLFPLSLRVVLSVSILQLLVSVGEQMVSARRLQTNQGWSQGWTLWESWKWLLERFKLMNRKRKNSAVYSNWVAHLSWWSMKMVSGLGTSHQEFIILIISVWDGFGNWRKWDTFLGIS